MDSGESLASRHGGHPLQSRGHDDMIKPTWMLRGCVNRKDAQRTDLPSQVRAEVMRTTDLNICGRGELGQRIELLTKSLLLA